MGDVCLYVGAKSSFNVQRLVENLGWMLGDEFDLDLVAAQREVFEGVEGGFEVYGGSEGPLRGYRSLRRYLAAEEPGAVVQLTEPPVHGVSAGTLATRHGVPFVYRYSGDRFYEYRVKRGLKRPLNFALNNVAGRIPLGLADSYVALGPTGKRRLVERGVDPGEVRILPPAVDASKFGRESRAREENDGVKRVLFVGRLTRLKGAEMLREAVPRVLERRGDVEFVLVGDEGEGFVLEERFRDRVDAVGTVPPEEVPCFYDGADLVVLPSLTEGVPNVLLESLASGTPVLARDVGDVESVTGNTFTSLDEFVDGILNMESLPLDDVEPFTREALKPRYVEFFESIV